MNGGDFYETVAERVYQAIAAHNWTIQQAADAAGINAHTLRNILRKNHGPSAQTMYLICVRWKISADWIFGLSEEGGPR